MQQTSDIQVRKKGFSVLFKELGEVDALRFLSQITHEKKDYMKLQDELFKGMDVDEIYARAKKHQERTGR
jgi:hypothetical protein